MLIRYSRFLLSITRANVKPSSVNLLSDGLKFIFSWVALMPIAIVVSGKLIAHVPAFKLSGQEGQMFGIKLPGIISFVAKEDEVVFGFGLFIADFFIAALVAGHAIYKLVESDFGINLGQFNAICAFSAFASVIVSGLVLMALAISGHVRTRTDPVLQQHAEELDRLSRGQNPSSSDASVAQS